MAVHSKWVPGVDGSVDLGLHDPVSVPHRQPTATTTQGRGPHRGDAGTTTSGRPTRSPSSSPPTRS